MEYAITVFFLGLMVTALVAKGLFAAQDFAKEELQLQKSVEPEVKIPR